MLTHQLRISASPFGSRLRKLLADLKVASGPAEPTFTLQINFVRPKAARDSYDDDIFDADEYNQRARAMTNPYSQ
jgi:aminoglycoside phosphotransferase